MERLGISIAKINSFLSLLWKINIQRKEEAYIAMDKRVVVFIWRGREWLWKCRALPSFRHCVWLALELSPIALVGRELKHLLQGWGLLDLDNTVWTILYRKQEVVRILFHFSYFFDRDHAKETCKLTSVSGQDATTIYDQGFLSSYLPTCLLKTP